MLFKSLHPKQYTKLVWVGKRTSVRDICKGDAVGPICKLGPLSTSGHHYCITDVNYQGVLEGDSNIRDNIFISQTSLSRRNAEPNYREAMLAE
jgi:hypothetical protein